MSRNRGRLFSSSFLLVSLLACSGKGAAPSASTIPKQVLGGGGGTLQVDVSLSHAGSLTANFARDNALGDTGEQANAQQRLSPGSHSFAIDLPEKTYGYLELKIPDASPGARLAWSIRLNGQPVGSETETLTKPLGANEAFFLQFEFNDLDEVRGAMSEGSPAEPTNEGGDDSE